MDQIEHSVTLSCSLPAVKLNQHSRRVSERLLSHLLTFRVHGLMALVYPWFPSGQHYSHCWRLYASLLPPYPTPRPKKCLCVSGYVVFKGAKERIKMGRRTSHTLTQSHSPGLALRASHQESFNILIIATSPFPFCDALSVFVNCVKVFLSR